MRKPTHQPLTVADGHGVITVSQAAALAGGVGIIFTRRRNSAAAQKSGAGSVSIEETHLRPGCKFSPSLKRACISRESGSAKLRCPSRAQAWLSLPMARQSAEAITS